MTVGCCLRFGLQVLQVAADLLDEEAGCKLVPLRVAVVAGADLLVGDPRRHQLPDQGDREPLLERADDQQIGDMNAVVALFDRLRHDPGPNVVVDRGGGDELLLLELRRKIIQMLLEQDDELLHIQAEVGDLLPTRQMISVQILFPAA